MTDRPVFGDFVQAAAGQLDATERRPGGLTRAADVEDTSRNLLRLVTAMSRCMATTISAAGDRAWREATAKPDPWTRARAETRDALDNAARFLRQRRFPSKGADTEPVTADGPTLPVARRLSAAASSLQAGRDLLQTHYVVKPGGLRELRSHWAPAITSDAVTAGMLIELSALAHRAAAQAAGTATAPSERGTREARRNLNTACQWLCVYVRAVRTAQREAPVSGLARTLLRELPLNVMPQRWVPVGGESVAELCGGVIDTAERGRRLARDFVGEAAWSPAMNITSLGRVAGAATITSHNCELVLTSLADSPLAGRFRQQLLGAAAAAVCSRESWLGVARSLDDVTTDTRGYLSPSAAEINDLALWTGRLAFTDSDWTPAAGPRHPVRPASSLVQSMDDMRTVVSAVHYTCDALAGLARASRDQIRQASRATRFLVPTRSLPETMEVPHPFSPAPQDRLGQLTDGYGDAAIASSRTARHVGITAEAIGAPSHMLTLAREATRGSGRVPLREQTSAKSEADLVVRGPLESVLRGLEVVDETLLRQAALLDAEGTRLVIRAAESTEVNREAPAFGMVDPIRSTAPVINYVFASAEPSELSALRPPELCTDREAEAGC